MDSRTRKLSFRQRHHLALVRAGVSWEAWKQLGNQMPTRQRRRLYPDRDRVCHDSTTTMESELQLAWHIVSELSEQLAHNQKLANALQSQAGVLKVPCTI